MLLFVIIIIAGIHEYRKNICVKGVTKLHHLGCKTVRLYKN